MSKIQLRLPNIAAQDDRSFWLHDIAISAATNRQEGEQHADVVIVGGGYTGLWTALRIREQAPETRVVVLEADFCGSGASGRNGGQVHSWFAELDHLSAVVGEQEAQQLCVASVDAIAELEQLQKSGAIDMDLRLDGWFWTASSKSQEGAWDRALALTKAAGVDRFKVLSTAEIEARTGSSASYAGIVEPNAGTVHPAKLAIGLRNLAIAKGVIIHEQSPVTNIIPGKCCKVQTPRGTVHGKKIVLATNAWLSAIPELRQYMYVVDSQVIATAEIPDFLDQIGWRDGSAICDSQMQVLYYQRTKGGRIVFGRGSGNVAFRGNFGADFNRSPEHGQDNIRELHRVYPALRDVPIEFDWAGAIDCVADHVPVFDHLREHPNIFFGMGFNGTGIAQTPVAGRILASLVLGKQDRWSSSGLVGISRRLKLPPEPFRYLGAKLVRHAIRRRNAAEIQNLAPGSITRFISELTPGRRVQD